MYILEIELSEAIKDVPNAVNNLILTLDANIYDTTSLNDAKWYYTFDVDDIENDFINKLNLKYDERLEYEIKNSICYLYMKINNKNTYDKLNVLPNPILYVIKEYVRILLDEQAKLTEKEIQQLLESGTHNYDLDSILEKIYKYGIDSLTPFEKIYLDKFSHEI